MRIIVAIDIIDGKCVRLTRGDYSTSRIYRESPLEVAKEIEDNGIGYLHLVDLDGARTGSPANLRILEKIAGRTGLKVDFGGGIRTAGDLKRVFESNASQITVGSIAVTDPPLFLDWLAEWGADKIILGADSRNRKISSAGWAEDSASDVLNFIKDYRDKGVKYTVSTDIEKDGMLQGPSVELYKEIVKIEGIQLIASGGISSIPDIIRLIETGCEGAIIGKAIYEGRITLKELSRLC
jgi:phosphoribosylformimino-5-aminoimidazole carboxamide ribotide isomerase